MTLKLNQGADAGGMLMGAGPEGYIVSIADIVPPARFDGIPWETATISESANSAGPFNEIASFTLDPVDSDPTDPAPRSFTTTAATLPAGWYQLAFQDAAGGQVLIEPFPWPEPERVISPYCSVLDVQARSANRPVTASSVPNIGQVQQFIQDAAGEINGILVQKGYLVPIVSASNPDAFATLHSLNVTGGWALMEASAPTSPNKDMAQKAWEAAKKMLSDAKFVLNAPMDMNRSEARGPWVTSHPNGRTFDPLMGRHEGGHRGNPRNPYFTREMQF